MEKVKGVDVEILFLDETDKIFTSKDPGQDLMTDFKRNFIRHLHFKILTR